MENTVESSTVSMTGSQEGAGLASALLGEDVNTQVKEKPAEQQTQKKPETEQQTQQNTQPTEPETPKVNPFINTFQQDMKLNGLDIEVPDELKTPDADPQKVIGFMENKLQEKIASKDPFISEYLKAKEMDGFTPEKFIENYSKKVELINLPSKDLLKRLYLMKNGKTEENPNGWEVEDVDNYLSKMSRIEIDEQAENLRKQLKTDLFNTKVDPEIKKQRINTVNKAVEEKINTLKEIMGKEESIGGIPHTKEDAEEFAQFFTDISKTDPETGTNKLSVLINDDKVLYKALYLLWKAESNDNNIKNYISDFKENYKKEVLDKTRVNPRQESGSSRNIQVLKPEDYV